MICHSGYFVDLDSIASIVPSPTRTTRSMERPNRISN